ncbi:Uncharacterised protein [Mycobacteroides abscessus]|nr:Uncharacterised protein [Mycobacteroides abscessus]
MGATHREEPDEQQRPQEVELLLDAERPVVLEEGRGLRLLEVLRPLVGEEEVRHVRCGRERVHGSVAHADRSERERGDDHRGDQHGERGREDPAGATRVELREPDPALRLERPQEMARDEEARDHEEDVHADVAARQPRHARVVEHHGHHRDGAQALHVETETVRRSTRRRARRGERRAGSGGPATPDDGRLRRHGRLSTD